MITLKKLGPESAGMLSELSISTFVQAYNGIHSDENLNRYCQENYSELSVRDALSAETSLAVIAYSNSETAGFYLLNHQACPIPLDGRSSELKQIYVLAKHYGTGLGLTLFQSVIEYAKSNGSTWLWLCVSDVNLRAVAFYKKLEFSIIEPGPTIEVGSDRLSSSIMSLKI